MAWVMAVVRLLVLWRWRRVGDSVVVVVLLAAVLPVLLLVVAVVVLLAMVAPCQACLAWTKSL